MNFTRKVWGFFSLQSQFRAGLWWWRAGKDKGYFFKVCGGCIDRGGVGGLLIKGRHHSPMPQKELSACRYDALALRARCWADPRAAGEDNLRWLHSQGWMSIMLAAIMCVCMCETNHSVVDASMPYVQLWILSMCVCISVCVCLPSDGLWDWAVSRQAADED